MSTTLLATKLHFQQSRSNLVSRQRLVCILEKGLRGPKTLIAAPAGDEGNAFLSQKMRLTLSSEQIASLEARADFYHWHPDWPDWQGIAQPDALVT